MTEKRTVIVIPRNGIATGSSNVRAVFSPVAANMLQSIGTIQTQRASHVEPGSELSQYALACLGRRLSIAVIPLPVSPSLAINPDYANHWFADMTPTGIPVVLGPYEPADRDKALHDEVQWLLENNIPIPVSP